MRCEDFDPRRYADSLMLAVDGEKDEPSALEFYLHTQTCDKDRKRFDQYLAGRELALEDLALVGQGLEIVEEYISRHPEFF